MYTKPLRQSPRHMTTCNAPSCCCQRPLTVWCVLLECVRHQPAAVGPVWLEGSLAVPLDVVVIHVAGAAQLRVRVPADDVTYNSESGCFSIGVCGLSNASAAADLSLLVGVSEAVVSSYSWSSCTSLQSQRRQQHLSQQRSCQTSPELDQLASEACKAVLILRHLPPVHPVEL
jgi:hypothetical protein